ncbi:MAG: protein DA1 [Lentisphaerae bacterium]|nr:protein DA1 [Lentisphaerota bacterium]
MKYRLVLILLAGCWGLLLPYLAAAGDELACDNCRRLIKGKFIKSGKKNYCSHECFDSVLPKCRNCGKAIRGGYIKTNKGIFCSQLCLDKKLKLQCMTCGKFVAQGMALPTPYGVYKYCMECGKRPVCLVCQRPLKQLTRLPNTGYICKPCNVDIVDNHKELQWLFNRVKNTLIRKFNFKFDHHIELMMRSYGVDRDHKFIEHQELGVFIYRGREVISVPKKRTGKSGQPQASVKHTDEFCKIVVLDHLPRSLMAEVLAHELAHDYMKHRWYYIKDLKIQEGFAELVAAEYNSATGNGKWNYRKEKSKDKVYGDGYRLLRSWHKAGGWKEVFRRLDAINRKNLPKALR